MNIQALLNVHNFKTKPPFDKWSMPYDRALQNTAFVKKMMTAPPCVGAFQKSPNGNEVKTERSTIHELQKIMDKEAPLNVRNFKTKPPVDEWSTPYDRALQNTAFVKKMMTAPRVLELFRKAPTETKSKQKEVQFMNCKRSWTKRLL